MNTYLVVLQMPFTARQNPRNHTRLVVVAADSLAAALNLALNLEPAAVGVYRSEQLPAGTARTVRA